MTRDKLLTAYMDYCQHVSARSMALSIETATLLFNLCETVDAVNVADFGSGFSSYVLRRYAADHPGVQVTSVDDNAAWLAKTGGFLDRWNLVDGLLMSWDEYREKPTGPHDVILHDLAGGELRNESMPFVADQARAGGLVVFDDMQHEPHREAAAGLVGFEWLDTRAGTLDEIGRFAVVGVRL